MFRRRLCEETATFLVIWRGGRCVCWAYETQELTLEATGFAFSLPKHNHKKVYYGYGCYERIEQLKNDVIQRR